MDLHGERTLRGRSFIAVNAGVPIVQGICEHRSQCGDTGKSGITKNRSFVIAPRWDMKQLTPDRVVDVDALLSLRFLQHR